ncbi:hypothetical protein CO610_02125 [Lysobacteraceae bacterium NML95-0200]|nr:hypothetical protein CO610_02125 [Xanthomonadaceae bacterium NML95-0200]
MTQEIHMARKPDKPTPAPSCPDDADQLQLPEGWELSDKGDEREIQEHLEENWQLKEAENALNAAESESDIVAARDLIRVSSF